VDAVYATASKLPECEKFILSSQIERTAASLVLNLAEGSSGQSHAVQNRFLGLALPSYPETIA
jgi:four helix bundle protein